MTLLSLLRRNRDEHGAKPAVITENHAITHAELEHASRALAARLAAAGVGKGACVGLLMPNGIEWAVVAAAVWRIGGVLVPLSTLLRPPELATQLQAAGVAHLVLARRFRDRSYLDDMEAIAPGIAATTRAGSRHHALPFLEAVWPVDDLPHDAVDDALVEALEAAVRAADDFVVLFTSGSRGAPKGVVHTHGSTLHAVAASLDARRVGVDDRLYIPMPFFWTGGLAGGLLSVLVAGATLLTEAIPEPDRTLDLLERERATLFRGWPDQAARLASHPRFAGADLSSLGPGSLPAVLPAAQRPPPGARANLFGMTETFGPYCGARLDRDLPAGKEGSCGQPFDGVEIRIVDPESGTTRAAGEIGEIRVRGRNVMRAIRGRPRDTTFDVDGWYPTADLGALDADGYLWYHGRLDDMFKVKGATVYPAEVETAIRAVAGVQQAHVTNVPADGDGDAVGVLVVSDVSLAHLLEATRERLSAFKVPTCWLVTPSADAVPMTATSKVDKGALQGIVATRRDKGMTRAIDGLVNVDLGDREQPDWMVRVKEDYFKGGDSFFKSPELSELLDDMDAHGVERAILLTQVGATEGRALSFVEARPDRFALGVGGFNLLKPMKTVRALEAFVRDHPVAYASVGPSFWGDGMYPPTDAVYFPLYTKCCELDLALCMNAGIPGPPLPAEPQNPIHLDRVCYRFPELKLCMIHGADPWWDTAIRLMLKYRNLRLMTSAWSPKRLPPSLLHYMSTRGKDRILFASDYPVLSFERCLGEVANLDLDDEVRQRWLYDNADAFFFGAT